MTELESLACDWCLDENDRRRHLAELKVSGNHVVIKHNFVGDAVEVNLYWFIDDAGERRYTLTRHTRKGETVEHYGFCRDELDATAIKYLEMEAKELASLRVQEFVETLRDNDGWLREVVP